MPKTRQKEANIFRQRRELFDYLEDYMAKSYEKLKEEGQLEYEQNLLKSYIVETNIDLKSFYNNFTGELDLKLKKFDDKDIYNLTYSKKDDLGATFYLDTMNPRFWVFHTIGDVKSTDYFIRKIVSPVLSRLDHPWLDKQLLLKIKEKNADITRGIGIQYKYGQIFPTEDDNGETFTMRVWGSVSDELLKQLSDIGALKHMLSLTSVGFKKGIELNEEKTYTVIEDLNYQCKFSVKGTSVYEHLDILDNVQTEYETILTNIEDNYNFVYEKRENSISIDGQPILIVLKREIKDLETFLNVIISSKYPFRFAGFYKEIGKDLFTVSGIDLHNGDNFDFEITPEWIRIYLQKGSCGNTVLRFLSNLQRYYDSNAFFEGI